MSIGIELRRAASEHSMSAGEYAHVLRHTPGQMQTVIICCPRCSTRFQLKRDVPKTGLVEPAVSCSACGMFELLVLVGWALPG